MPLLILLKEYTDAEDPKGKDEVVYSFHPLLLVLNPRTPCCKELRLIATCL